jgi:hypothetical protein
MYRLGVWLIGSDDWLSDFLHNPYVPFQVTDVSVTPQSTIYGFDVPSPSRLARRWWTAAFHDLPLFIAIVSSPTFTADTPVHAAIKVSQYGAAMQQPLTPLPRQFPIPGDRELKSLGLRTVRLYS